MSKAEPGSILETGADALDVVEGMTEKNVGLRLRVKQPQVKHENGWLKGRFEILDEGNGYYAAQIKPLVGETMNAADFVEAVLANIGNTTKKKLTVVDRNSLKVLEKHRS